MGIEKEKDRSLMFKMPASLSDDAFITSRGASEVKLILPASVKKRLLWVREDSSRININTTDRNGNFMYCFFAAKISKT
jgi:hypothetical protein